jgi:1-acyl-sn-glycerol-3-phosphate acyltransferase
LLPLFKNSSLLSPLITSFTDEFSYYSSYGANFMGKFGHAMKYMVKMAMYHNPFDAFVSWHRRHLAKKGPENLYKYDQLIYWRIGYIFFPKILKFTNKFTFSGYENVKGLKGPFMVICNHNDSLDPFYAGTALSCGTRRKMIHVSWVSKLGNMYTPVMKSIVKYFGTIALGPGRKMDATTRRDIEQVIAHKQGIGFFPEGGRSKDRSEIRQFHAGAARLCIEYKLPYVPVCLTGKRFFFKGRSTARIGKPVYLNPYLECNYDNAVLVADDMHAQVQALFVGKTEQPRCRFEITKPETPVVVEQPTIIPVQPALEFEVQQYVPARLVYRPSAAAIEARQYMTDLDDASRNVVVKDRPVIDPAPRRLE